MNFTVSPRRWTGAALLGKYRVSMPRGRPWSFSSNLRSGSIFVSLWKLHCDGQGETKREPDTNLLPNVCRPILIDICRISQPKLLPLLVFLVCKFFKRGKKADWLLQLKIKQSAQSHLTSCEIKGDLESYFCWRRRSEVFEKTATRCFTSFILARRARI